MNNSEKSTEPDPLQEIDQAAHSVLSSTQGDKNFIDYVQELHLCVYEVSVMSSTKCEAGLYRCVCVCMCFVCVHVWSNSLIASYPIVVLSSVSP